MPKKMLIDATHAEETRVVVVDGNKVEEFDFETVNKRQLAGNIYLAKVTRVEPSLQAAFVDYGGNRHGFLAFSEIHPDYYQIPVADREALLAEEAAYAKQQEEEDERRAKPRSRGRKRAKPVAEAANTADAILTEAVEPGAIGGMDVVDVALPDDHNQPMLGFADATNAVAADAVPADSAPEPTAETADATPDAPDPETANTPEAGDTADGAATDDNATEDGDDAADDATGESYDDEDNDSPQQSAANADPSIESVAQEDEREEIRPRKPRPRRYKIQEVIKVRQILLIQVVKEERGNKGAALTTYLSLAGRYCVLMPNTARGGGISRKITNAPDRKKLKDIAAEIVVPQGAGLIIRTAGAKRTKSEIKRDYDYLLRQWEEVRDLTLKSIAPAPIYEEGSLIKRSIRDLYNREIDEILIEGETGYRMAKDYMKMLMPSHSKNVKLYHEPLPLFARFQVESYLSGMFNPNVQLKSGGYIVIGVTEALVAIDVNSGRATKETSIEDTALKTNLEAAEEVARQLRLRDLAGLIVIDFIDMEDRRNNAAVEKRIKDRLKTDRARIQVGRISGFGLMEMSRQRLRPGMIEATTAPCPHCHGTGLTRSDDSLALSILRELEEEGVRRRSREVLVTVPVTIANYILNQKREHVAMIEGRYGLSVRIEASPTLISPDFTIERFKTATRSVPEPSAAQVVSMETSLIDAAKIPEAAPVVETAPEPLETGDDGQPKKKRRRRRRRGGRGRSEGEQTEANNGENGADTAETLNAGADAPQSGETGDTPVVQAPEPAPALEPDATGEPAVEVAAEPEKPVKKRTTRRASTKKTKEAGEAETQTPETEKPAKAPVKKRRSRSKKVVAQEAPATEGVDQGVDEGVDIAAEPQTAAPEPVQTPEPIQTPQPAVVQDAAPVEPAAAPAEPAAAPAEPAKPKRRGWWSRG